MFLTYCGWINKKLYFTRLVAFTLTGVGFKYVIEFFFVRVKLILFRSRFLKSPALWANRQTLSEFQSSLCPTNSLAYKATYAAMLYEKKMNAFGYAREREQFIENAREKCRNWRNEFENQFKTSCDMSLAEFGPLAADLCIMVHDSWI